MGEQHVGAADLREAFGVTEADLAANGRGRLAPNQQRRLRRMGLVNALLTLAVAAGLTAVWLAVVEHPVRWWQWLLVAALQAVVLGAAARWIAALLAAARDGVVVRHSGPIQVSGRSGKQLTVDELTYGVPIRLNRLVQGASYDVYVIERPPMVVAMVPADPDSP